MAEAEPSTTTGPVVPTLKVSSSNEIPTSPGGSGGGGGGGEGGQSGGGDSDSDFLCPICMQVIKDAFLTACGHSYCYMCIATHLRNKNDCPSCGRFLSPNLLFPNFALNKLLKKMYRHHFVRCGSYTEQLCQLLKQQDCEVSVKDLDSLLSLLAEKKRKMQQEEVETSLQILLEFLVCLRQKKVERLKELQDDLQYIREDINVVQKRKLDLLNSSQPPISRTSQDFNARRGWLTLAKHSAVDCGTPNMMTAGNYQHREDNTSVPVCSQDLEVQGPNEDSNPPDWAPSERFVVRKRQIEEQFINLQECYFQKRRHWAEQLCKVEGKNQHDANNFGMNKALEDFQSVLTSFTQFSTLGVVSELRHGDAFHSANIVSSIEFDRDDELFATAGVSRRIKIFEFSSVLNEPAEVHCAVVDIATRSKLSCLSWNKYSKQNIASSDYEGIVTIWDVTTRQSVREYEEHEKRAWSVDFSRTEPSLLVSGGDDCKVKIWCTKQEESVLNINMSANICSVKCNPGSSMHVAVGSADHQIHYYDLRNVSQPVHVFSGHRKAVSYVKFMSSHELASASTDSTLRLWDVNEKALLQVYRGHTNEKNFVGLSANSDYLSCGSETNDVFVYHKAITKPVARYRFSTSALDDANDNNGSHFISAVCWKSDSPMLMAANSQGMIKVLSLAP